MRENVARKLKPEVHLAEVHESRFERERETLRKKLADRGSRELIKADMGLLLRSKKNGEIGLEPEVKMRRSSPGTEKAPPLTTFDGFQEMGISNEALREDLEDVLCGIDAKAVRVSASPQRKTVHLKDGRTVDIVSEWVKEAGGFLKQTIYKHGHETPTREEVAARLQEDLSHHTRWAQYGVDADEIALILVARSTRLEDWMNRAFTSLLSRGLDAKEAQKKVDIVISDLV